MNRKIRLFNPLYTRLNLLFAFSLFFYSCSGSSDRQNRIETILNLEQKMQKNEAESDQLKNQFALLIHQYQSFIKDFPHDSVSAVFLYNQAMLNAEKLQSYHETIILLDRFLREFPDHVLAGNALFLKGFTYSEFLKDFSNAKITYEAFIQKYPHSEMIPSIEYELKHLGKSPEEILKKTQDHE